MTRWLLWMLAVSAAAAFAVGNAHASVTTKSGTGATVLNGEIVFDSTRSPGDSSAHVVFTIDADGSGLTELTTPATPTCSSCGNSGDPAWSPDGTQIAFDTGLFSGGDHCCETLGLMNADGSNKHLLIKGDTTLCGNNEAPAWSPDGAQIVFVSCNDGFATLDLVNADGSGFRILKQFSNPTLEVLHPTWSPDGSRIAYMRVAGDGFHIFTTSAADGSGETDLGIGDDPEYSPDGTQIVYDKPRGSNDTGLWMMDADGSNQTQITQTYDYEPSWSPDGSRIVFGSQRTGAALIWTSNPDGSDAIAITAPSDGVDLNPSWQNGGGSGGGRDTTPPTITVTRTAPTGQNGWDTKPVAVTVSASDAGGIASIDCSPFVLTNGELTVSQEGATNVVCTATDNAGNTAAGSAQIELDTVKPALAPTLSEASIAVGDHVTADPGATDTTSGIASASCDPVDTSFIGGNSVRCTATDNAGNTNAASLLYLVHAPPDTTPPSVTIPLPATLGQNGWFIAAPVPIDVRFHDASAIASASCSPIAATITGIGTTDAFGGVLDFHEGVTDLTCTATDTSGNTGAATAQIELDSVKPALAPTLSEASIAVGDHVTADPGATDATSGIASASCDPVDTSFIGGNSVRCTATDNAGNTNAASLLYLVHAKPDTTPPTIQLTVPPPGPLQLSGWYRSPVAVTVDAIDANGVASIDCGSFPLTTTGIGTSHATATLTVDADGITDLACTANDIAGNTSPTATQELELDTTKPTLSPSITPGTVFLHALATVAPHASDATSGIAVQACEPTSTSTVGVHTLTCTATDNAGNTATAVLSYLVQYKVSFALPAANTSWPAGVPLPISLRLADAANVAISDATAHALVTHPCKVRVAATGVQSFSACATYLPLPNVFRHVWPTHASPTGGVALSVTITYPGGQVVTTKEHITLH